MSNLPAMVPLLALLATAALTLGIARRCAPSLAGRILLAVLLTFSLWSFSSFMFHTITFPSSIFWLYLIASLGQGISVLSVHFTTEFPYHRRGPKWLVIAYYLLGLAMLTLLLRGGMVESASLASSGLVKVSFGPLAPVGWAWITLCLSASIGLLAHTLLSQRGAEEKKRAVYPLIGFIILLLGFLSNIVVSAYPVDVAAGIVFVGFLSYAVVKGHLLRPVEEQPRYLALLIGLWFGVLIYGALLVVLWQWLALGIATASIVAALIVGVTAAVLVKSTRVRIQRWLAKLLFPTTFHYWKALDRLKAIDTSAGRWQDSLTQLLDAQLEATRATTSAFFVFEKESGCFEPAVARGANREAALGHKLAIESPFVSWLRERKQVLSAQDIQRLPQFRVLLESERKLLEECGLGLFCGVYTAQGLIGIVGLGHESWDSPFTQEDIEFCAVAANNAAPIIADTLRRQAEEALRDSEARLRLLSRRIINAQEEERARISREVHDQLGQEAIAIKLEASSLARRFQADPVLQEQAMELATMADQMVSIAKHLAGDLRPRDLDELGLVKAIQSYAEEFERRTSISCPLDVPRSEPNVTKETAIAAYRILQEALTNVWRHAKASQVNVTLAQKGNSILLSISDDGVGFESSQLRDRSSLGLFGMRERAQLVGGRLQTRSRPSKGTQIIAHLPMSID